MAVEFKVGAKVVLLGTFMVGAAAGSANGNIVAFEKFSGNMV
jgi:hypothetical protein